MKAIDLRLAQITDEQASLEAQLQRAREDAEHIAASVTGLPDQIAATERSLASADEELADVRRELAGVQRAANQLDRDLQTLREGADTESILGTIPFVTCPRCDHRWIDALRPRGIASSACNPTLPPPSISSAA